ncbi:hypothetical protein DSO57_1005294 [Entomophthora muscae]|uniref:Uncharacterized protein n=1 Tax=Entomophthora muscae TaxID=34485 RepID=A0ACC2TJ37_9FUNG|nr:hypothetical protein DSO57_1005294 [Entomophthora muscae]
MMRFGIILLGFVMTLSIYDHVIVFGDSLSDTGNYFRHISSGTFPDPDFSFQGRFSNGPVWVEYLAKSLDAKLTNYAYASSTTDGNVFPGTKHHHI